MQRKPFEELSSVAVQAMELAFQRLSVYVEVSKRAMMTNSDSINYSVSL